MAKRGRKPKAPIQIVSGLTGAALSAALTKAVELVRAPFLSFAESYGLLQASRAELAPQFMATFEDWQKETGRSQFVEYVRVIDPTVPVERDGYRAHKSYQAADYLRRLAGRTDTGNGRARPVRSAGWRLARLIATIVPMVKEGDRDELWKAIGEEFDLRSAQLRTLRRMTNATQPLIETHVRPQPLKVIHIAAPEQAQVAA